jgi:hypothetical protein
MRLSSGASKGKGARALGFTNIRLEGHVTKSRECNAVTEIIQSNQLAGNMLQGTN